VQRGFRGAANKERAAASEAERKAANVQAELVIIMSSLLSINQSINQELPK